MAIATFDLPNGTKVTVDGSPDEIKTLSAFYSSNKVSKFDTRGSDINRRVKGSQGGKKGPSRYIMELEEEGYFDERRSISDVQNKLEEKGYIYPLTHLSTPLRRLVRARALRRMKEGSNWVYVKR